jgi:hypothetical protein
MEGTMVEIFSQRGAPRPQDARLKVFLDQNRATIVKMADHLTQGGYSARKAAKTDAPPPSTGQTVYVIGESASASPEARPCVRATLNGRVVVVDDNSGRQLWHLGQIRVRTPN